MALFKITTSILLGLILALYLVPKDPGFKAIINQHTTNFLETNFDFSTQFTMDQINIFSGTGILRDIKIRPKNHVDQSWYWTCKKLVIEIDWFYLLTKHIFKTKIKIQKLEVYTEYCHDLGNLAIAPHVNQILFTPSTVPFEISNLDIDNGCLDIFDRQQNISFKLNWHSETKLLENSLKTNIYLKDSDLKNRSQIFLNQLAGHVQIDMSLNDINQISMKSHAHFTLPSLDRSDQYFLKIKYQNNQASCQLNSLNGAIDFIFSASASSRVNELWQMSAKGTLPSITGKSLISIHAIVDHSYNLNGSCQIENLGKSDFMHHDNLWTGTFLFQKFKPDLPIKWQLNPLQNQIDAFFDLQLINKLLPKDSQNMLNCAGELAITTTFTPHNLSCTLKLIDGNLVLPKIYNIIETLDGKIILDLKNHLLKLDQIKLRLHQGQIAIPCATIQWTHDFDLDYLYFPVIFTNCAISYDRQLNTCLSGKILYQKSNLTDHLSGFIALEQSLCKYNLFSGDFENIFNQTPALPNKFKLNPSLNLHVFTLSPIKIHSETLETNVSAKLQIINHLLAPQVIGKINIMNGKIKFPYKPLYITHGNIYFTPEQSSSPIIHLNAKNRIKHHNITMQINGSTKNPQVKFESSPSLTNEEIGALLLVGSENSTLNKSMPTIIMQNLNQILFGLDHVKFIPSFSDEAGHPTIAGAVEIDVGDRLHASIKKNFNTQEDTKFEVDYAVTDDVSIRGVKDERGDLGGEIEIRLRI